MIQMQRTERVFAFRLHLCGAEIVQCGNRSEYGIVGAALSLPCVVGRGGVEKVLTPELAPGEEEALRKSAERVKELLAGMRQ